MLGYCPCFTAGQKYFFIMLKKHKKYIKCIESGVNPTL